MFSTYIEHDYPICHGHLSDRATSVTRNTVSMSQTMTYPTNSDMWWCYPVAIIPKMTDTPYQGNV